VQFHKVSEPCVLDLEFVLSNFSQANISINHIGSDAGSVLSHWPGFIFDPYAEKFNVRFQPEQPWAGGQSCFDLYLKINGQDCCIPFCVDLPCCDCGLTLDSLQIGCSGPQTPAGWFDFSFNADLSGSPGFSYSSSLSATLNGQPATILNYQPATLQDGLQQLSGQVNLQNMQPGDSLCLTLTSSLQDSLSCEAVICGVLPPAPCDIQPDFTYSFDPDSCTLTLSSTSLIDPCTRVDSANYSWTVTMGAQQFYASGLVVTFHGIQREVMVDLTVLGLNYTGNQDCHPNIVQQIDLPDCNCLDNCNSLDVSMAEFIEFFPDPSPEGCTLKLRVAFENPLSLNIQPNRVISGAGEVIDIHQITAGDGVEFEITFVPDQPWSGCNACFEFFFFLPDGTVCCIPFCVDLPACDCSLELSNLDFDCTDQCRDFDFTFDLNLDACPGFDYNLDISLFGNPDTLVSYQPLTVQGGNQQVNGTIRGQAGNYICFAVSTELLGVMCADTICGVFGESCEIDPDFSYSIDPYTCALTVSSTTTVGTCTYVSDTNYSWTVDINGQQYQGSGEQFTFLNLPPGEAEVCLQVTGVNSNCDPHCLEEICMTIEIPECVCEPECEGLGVDQSDFQHFFPEVDPCVAYLDFTLFNPQQLPLSINAITTTDGLVQTYFSNGGSSTYPSFGLTFQPTPIWPGGTVCFDVYIELNGEDCCLEMCVYVPPCGEGGIEGGEEENGFYRLPAKEKELSSMEMDIYPNPAKSSIFIRLGMAGEENLHVSLQDQTGKEVMNVTYLSSLEAHELKLKGLAEGVYLLRIQQGELEVRKKIVIVK
jgi:hypothetical protein